MLKDGCLAFTTSIVTNTLYTAMRYYHFFDAVSTELDERTNLTPLQAVRTLEAFSAVRIDHHSLDGMQAIATQGARRLPPSISVHGTCQ